MHPVSISHPNSQGSGRHSHAKKCLAAQLKPLCEGGVRLLGRHTGWICERQESNGASSPEDGRTPSTTPGGRKTGTTDRM